MATEKSPSSHLATTIENWLKDRPLMRVNNSPENIAKLLLLEMDELHEALEKRATITAEFDETPGEIADVIFFALSLKSALNSDLHSSIQTASEQGHTRANLDELDYLANQIVYAAQIGSERNMDLFSAQFLEAAYTLSAELGYDATAETLEKAAYNHTRYLSRNFHPNTVDSYLLNWYEAGKIPGPIQGLVKSHLERQYRQRKKAGRAETKALNLKGTFYEYSFERERKKTPQTFRQRAVRLALTTTSVLQGLGF